MRFLRLSLLLALSAASAFAQAALPDTAPGHLMSEWLQHFDAGDRPGLTAFIKAHYSAQNLQDTTPEMLARQQMRFRERTGGLDVYKAEESSATELTAIFKTRSILPVFIRGSYKVDAANAALIVASGFSPAPAPAGAFEKPAPDTLTRDRESKRHPLT